MMHIVFTTSASDSSRGGSEHLWVQAAERLVKLGHCVTAVVAGVVPAGVEVIPLQAPRLLTLGERIGRKLGVAKVEQGYDCFDRLAKPDVVVSSLAYFGHVIPVAQQCLARGWRYLNLIHTGSHWGWQHDDALATLRTAFEGATANCFVADATRKIVEEQIAAEVPRAKKVFNPFFADHAAVLPWPDGDLKLALPARYDCSTKAFEVIFDVLARTVWRERLLTLTLFGEGPNETTLRRLITRNGLENKVILAGFASDVAAIWKSHHALLLASRMEGLPLVVVEAMLSGRVPIVTAVGGSAELIADNRTGFVAAAATPDLLHDALERAWQRRTEWPAIGSAAAISARAQIPADPVGHFCEVILCS